LKNSEYQLEIPLDHPVHYQQVFYKFVNFSTNKKDHLYLDFEGKNYDFH